MSQGTLDQFWIWSMQAGLKNAYESIKAFSETDFTEDLKKFDVPALVMHGEDDQIVPVKDSRGFAGLLPQWFRAEEARVGQKHVTIRTRLSLTRTRATSARN